jgi:hypothetical protein
MLCTFCLGNIFAECKTVNVQNFSSPFGLMAVPNKLLKLGTQNLVKQ